MPDLLNKPSYTNQAITPHGNEKNAIQKNINICKKKQFRKIIRCFHTNEKIGVN